LVLRLHSQYYMSEIKNLIHFFKRPNYETQIEIKSFPLFIKLILKSYLILVLIDIVVGLAVILPLKHYNLFPSQTDMKFDSITILKGILILPVIEELIFRLPLRFSRLNVALAFSMIIFLIFNKLFFYVALSVSAALFIINYLFLKKDSLVFRFVEDQIKRHFIFLFYLQGLIFGFLHLSNYNLDSSRFYLFPLFIMSFILSGFYFGYLRVRYNYGVFVCAGVHILNNCIYCLVFYK
jgi:hypothetical protein